MEKIEFHAGSGNEDVDVFQESSVMMREASEAGKKKIKALLPKTGLIVSFFLTALVVVIMTTDVSLLSFQDPFKAIGDIGVSFFLMYLAQYSAYVASSDSGLRAGALSEPYKQAREKYAQIKQKCMEDGIMSRLYEWCVWFCDKELECTRKQILSNVGIDYDDYVLRFLGKDKKYIKSFGGLQDCQIEAILRANAVMRIRLTPDMLIQCERMTGTRAPLGRDPKTKMIKAYRQKIFSSTAISLLTSSILFDALIDFSWASLAPIALKIFLCIMSIFCGYSLGFNNKAVDAAGYITDQADLLTQFWQYCQETPIIKNQEDLENHEDNKSDCGREGEPADDHDGREAGEDRGEDGMRDSSYHGSDGDGGQLLHVPDGPGAVIAETV